MAEQAPVNNGRKLQAKLFLCPASLKRNLDFRFNFYLKVYGDRTNAGFPLSAAHLFK